MVKRNRDYFALVSQEHLKEFLSPFTFEMEYEQEEDKSYSGSLKGFDVVANAETVEGLRTELAKEILEYAKMYMDDFQACYNSSNRRSHFPYVLNVLIQDSMEGVEKLIYV